MDRLCLGALRIQPALDDERIVAVKAHLHPRLDGQRDVRIHRHVAGYHVGALRNKPGRIDGDRPADISQGRGNAPALSTRRCGLCY